jgi:5-formyltetrahydrofolate cyclo-ligase
MDAKQVWRERIWDRMVAEKVVGFPGAHGRIPNFTGAAEAARALAELPEWRAAAAVKANPDMPQLPVRARALEDDLVVFMAVPRLRDPAPFLRLDPAVLEVKPRAAASIKGSSEHGVPVGLDELPHIDLIVCGTVAVNRDGARIGKGGGYSDLEFAIGLEAGVIDEDTVIVTTVHDVQVVDAELPETDHDFRVDVLVTPTEVIRCPRVARPPGVIWQDLDDEKIDAIPVLAERAR